MTGLGRPTVGKKACIMSGQYTDSIRESLLRLDFTPMRVTEEVGAAEPAINDSLRKLSRARVALILRQLRAAHGLSYAQVQTDTGLSQQLLFDMEFGDARLTLDQLIRLADCYNISVDDILGINIE